MRILEGSDVCKGNLGERAVHEGSGNELPGDGKALGVERRTAKKLCMMEDVPEPRVRERYSIIDPFTEVIDAWLEKRPSLKASVITAQLEPLGWTGSYATVKRYVAARKAELNHRVTVRFETLPGYQAQVDFGKVMELRANGLLPDRTRLRGRERTSAAAREALSAADLARTWLREDPEAWLEAHMPAPYGPDGGRPWARVLRGISRLSEAV